MGIIPKPKHILPWEVTPGPAQAPGVPGDIPEEIIESLRELERGELPWASEGRVRLVTQNTVIILAGVAVYAYARLDRPGVALGWLGAATLVYANLRPSERRFFGYRLF